MSKLVLSLLKIFMYMYSFVRAFQGCPGMKWALLAALDIELPIP